MIWKTAWKNVWRNKVRSLVVISSVTVGIFSGIFAVALMNGMIAQRVDDALNQEICHIQVNMKDFRINNDPQLYIADPVEIISLIRNIDGVSAAATRTVITGMANTAGKSSGVQIIGIDPGDEKEVLSVNTKIMPGTGDYFEKSSRFAPVLIGEELAKSLIIVRYSVDSLTLSQLRAKGIPETVVAKVGLLAGKRFAGEKKFIRELKASFASAEEKNYGQTIISESWRFREGSRLTLTFLDSGNNQVAALFRLTGLYDIYNSMFESTTVFVRRQDLNQLIGLPSGACHEILVRIKDIDETERITAMLEQKLPGYEVISWKKLQPDLAMMTDLVNQFYFVFGIIILAALAFGIINTMLMVVLERTRELGMLTAIGMNRKKVFSMIMLESVFLSLVGGVAGMIAGYLVVKLTAGTGINLGQYSEGFEALGYSALVYPSIGPGFFAVITVLIIITGVVSSVYPAIKALKLKPVEAIRAE